MKVLTPGHLYELDSMEEANPQLLQFIQKLKNAAGQFVTVQDGTTNEEVLKVLIDRLRTLGEKLPSRENALAITKAEECLMWLEKRTANRLAQGVENTPLPHK